MTTLYGTVQDGKIVVDVPPGVPDGTRVTIRPVNYGLPGGLPDDGLPPSPEEIAARLAAMDAVPGGFLSDEARAAWDAERAARKAYELAKWEEESEKLGKLFE